MSDFFFRSPSLSAPKYEAKFAPRKPRCHVLINGTAYAPFEGIENKSENPSEHGPLLPNTEKSFNRITWFNGSYKPKALDAIVRQSEPRSRFAGTYHRQWLDRTFPFLPGDFDQPYHQAAPLDQQLGKPLRVVKIDKLTADSRRDFVLPQLQNS